MAGFTQEQQMAMLLMQQGQGLLNPMSAAIPGVPQPRRNAAAGTDLIKAAAHAAGAAAAMKPTPAAPAPQAIIEDDEEEVTVNKCKAMIAQCNVENMTMWGKMFLDGASLRPALAGICFTQILVLVALTLTGMFPDTDAFVSISKPADMRSLINCGTADYASIKAGELYRIVACLFVHGGVLHLTGCLGLQIWFGEHLEFSMGGKKFAMLFTLSGVAGTLMGVAYSGPSGLAVVGACTSCAGLAGAFACYTLIHWNEWAKPYKGLVQILFLALMDIVLSFFPEGSIILGPLIGHTTAAIVGFGLGFAFHPVFDKHHSGLVKLGKLAAMAVTFMFSVATGSYIMLA
jgi:membrane associated rhomboid family serine protease